MRGTEEYASQQGTLGQWTTNSPDERDFSGDEDGFYPVTRLHQQYIDYLYAKQLEIEEEKTSRHYYHAAQWDADSLRILRNRRQPIITFNRISRKVDSVIGILQRVRQDPKAIARNPQHEGGAEVATECVRAICDSSSWRNLKSRCARQAAIEGKGGVEFKLVQGDQKDPDVVMSFVAGDDWFYDPRSYDPDFGDARYHGIAKWLDVEAAVELFPEREQDLRTLMVDTGFDLTTHADREFKWIYVNEKRLRLIEHWYRHKNKWYWAFYCSFILLDQGVSPFLDERNQPMSRFAMFRAMVDHDGDHYGLVRNLKGPQDEVNQRRSKSLFITNSRRLIMEKGAVDNVEAARKEWARPDGVVEVNPGRKIEPDDRQEDLKAQADLWQQASNEIDSFAQINPQMYAETQDEHSGVAINLLQKAGVAELGSFFEAYQEWMLRVYRMSWNIARRTWQQPRWIRIAPSPDLIQGMNANPNQQGANKFLQLNQPGVDQIGQPTIENLVGSLNVEITMDEGPDVGSMMQDAYDVLKQYPPGMVPPQVLIMLSPLADSIKKQVIQVMSQPPGPDPATQAKLQATQQQAQAKMQQEQIKGQIQQQKGQAEITKAHVAAQAEIFNARQDQAQRYADMELERERISGERARLLLEMHRDARKHDFAMQEMQMRNAAMRVQNKRRASGKAA